MQQEPKPRPLTPRERRERRERGEAAIRAYLRRVDAERGTTGDESDVVHAVRDAVRMGKRT